MTTNYEGNSEESKIHSLYHQILKYWNERNAVAMANLFESSGDLIGFDGSHFKGKGEIEKHLSYIFTNYPTPKYVGKIRGIRFFNPESGILFAVAGIIDPNTNNIRQELNTVQTLVALKQDKEEGWKIALYQNTPASYHDRPKLCEQLTEELTEILQQHGPTQ